MRRLGWLIVVGAVGLISSLIHADSHGSSLLTDNDYELEWSSREEGPALNSFLNAKEKWESYNTWHCFPKQTVALICTDIDYGGWRKSPTIVATTQEHRFEYDLDPTTPWDCDFTLNEWREVIGNSTEICLFGARLQSLEDRASLWILNSVKSQNGYWEEAESAAYAHAWHESDESDVDE
jgi:hypothetical protein